MGNKILHSKALPLKIVEMDKSVVPQYLTKHFNDWILSQQIKDYPYLEQKRYFQPFQKSDTIRVQFTSEYSPISMNLIDKKGRIIESIVFGKIGTNIYEAGSFLYEGEMALSAYDEGCYFLEFIFGVLTPKRFITEPLDIRVKHKNSLLYEYRNSRYRDDIIYETGIIFQFRVEGVIFYDETPSQRVSYPGQNRSIKLLSAQQQDQFTLGIGNSKGVPGWMVAKLSRIMNHNEIMIDGVYYTGIEDFRIDQKLEEGTWMRGISMKIVESFNRSSNVSLGNTNTNYALVIIHQVNQSVIFGDLDDISTNTIPIYDNN